MLIQSLHVLLCLCASSQKSIIMKHTCNIEHISMFAHYSIVVHFGTYCICLNLSGSSTHDTCMKVWCNIIESKTSQHNRLETGASGLLGFPTFFFVNEKMFNFSNTHMYAISTQKVTHKYDNYKGSFCLFV